MEQAGQKKLQCADYHVAWISPLAIPEFLSALLLLDEEHARPDMDAVEYNAYKFGKMAGHNVVLATCPSTKTGQLNTAQLTGSMFKTFTNIRMTLLVGIGGGIPQPNKFHDPLNDVRLGDVVVGMPSWADGLPAVVDYETGRTKTGGFEPTSILAEPHRVVLSALSIIDVDYKLDKLDFHIHLARLQAHKKLGDQFKHPGLEHDTLHQPDCDHIGDYSDCDDCDKSKIIARVPRNEDDKETFVYHRGRIATGNSVMMSGTKRDEIRSRFPGSLCIEMEAAGVNLNSQFLVIRGVSDYADSHKSDSWRAYAAGKATVFARVLLGKMQAEDVKEKMPAAPVVVENKHWIVNRSANPHFTGRRELIDRIVKAITPETDVNGQQRFVLTGLGGQGKSEICLQVANEVRDSFWGIFWIDASTRSSAAETFSEAAEALGCPKTPAAVRTTLSNLPSTRPWLLILDNADDPHRDYQIYLPSGSRGAVLMTSRNRQCCHFAKAGGHEEIDGLDEPECIQLLQKTAILSEVAYDSEDYASAVSLVKHLGYHTLAVLHAASYIATTHCSISEYQNILRKNRRRLHERPREQDKSRYDTVYATFGASVKFLELSDTGASQETCKDSLELLKILSTFNYTNVPLEVLVDACEGVKKALKTRREREMASGNLTAWHVARVPDFIRTENDDVDFRITEAAVRLESLALVRIDSSTRTGRSVSMHPLVHGWAGDRHDQAEKKEALRMTECIVALSYFAFKSWRRYHHQLAPHLKLVVETDKELMSDAARSRCILQACVQIAWIYHRAGLDRDMCEFTDLIFLRLDLHNQEPTDELREIYRAFAVAVDRERGCPVQALRVFEAIACLDEITRGENDSARLDNLRDLGRAYLDNAETEQAVVLLTKVVKARQELGPEHGDLLAAQHDLAWALARDGQHRKAITLLEKVVEIQQRSLPADDPEQLTSQSALGIQYLHDGQVEKAGPLFEQVLRVQAHVYGEEHCETATTRAWLASAYERDGSLPEAIALYEKVVHTRSLLLGENHRDVLMSRLHLATAYLDDWRATEALELMEMMANSANSTLSDINRVRLSSLCEFTRAEQEAANDVGFIVPFREEAILIKEAILEEVQPEGKRPSAKHLLEASRRATSREYWDHVRSYRDTVDASGALEESGSSDDDGDCTEDHESDSPLCTYDSE